MRIKKSAWYYRLFEAAYIRNRGWIDWFTLTVDSSDLPEYQQMEALKRSFNYDYTAGVLDAHVAMYYREVVVPACEAASERREQEIAAERANKVRERLEGGRKSLCPFFWSVVIAVVVYLPITAVDRVTGWIVGLIQRNVRRIGWAAAACGVLLTSYGATTLIIGNASDIASIPNAISRWHRERQEQLRLEEERERQQLEAEELERRTAAAQQRAYEEQQRAHEEWLRKWQLEHPEEVRLQAELEAKRHAEWEDDYQRRLEAVARADARRHEREREETIAMMKAFGIGAFKLLLYILGAWSLLKFLFKRMLMPWVFPAIEWLFIRIGRGLDFLFDHAILIPIVLVMIWMGNSKWLRGLLHFLGRISDVVRRGWIAVREFYQDTRDLVVAMIKATKERVCPFLEPVNGDIARDH